MGASTQECPFLWCRGATLSQGQPGVLVMAAKAADPPSWVPHSGLGVPAPCSPLGLSFLIQTVGQSGTGHSCWE